LHSGQLKDGSVVSKRSYIPNLLVADERGRLYEHPFLKMMGFDGNAFVPINAKDVIKLPPYSKLFYIPHSRPVGFDVKHGTMTVLEDFFISGKMRIKPNAVSAFLSPGHVRLYLPAAVPLQKRPILPLWAYCAVGVLDGALVSAAFQVEYNTKWDPKNYDDKLLLGRIDTMKKRFFGNRLLEHLINCAVSNHCFAAKNLFLERWEAPVPTSRACNASCLGCLSHQPEFPHLKSHERISFRPSVKEIVELCVHHLENAPEPIVSFGQGCEGEPLTEYLLVAESIKRIRESTKKGIINLNTNGSYPERVRILCEAGLNSIRISLNSARHYLYQAYFKPRGYGIEEVVESLKIAKSYGLYTMINYLIFPGVTDQEEELVAIAKIIEETRVDFIHLKNLCIDPWVYLDAMPRAKESKPMGLKNFYNILRKNFPQLSLGYFNQIPKQSFLDNQYIPSLG